MPMLMRTICFQSSGRSCVAKVYTSAYGCEPHVFVPSLWFHSAWAIRRRPRSAPHGVPSSCQSPCDGANPARIPSTDEAGDRTIQSSAVRYHMVPLACCRNPHPAMHCMPMKWIATIHDLIGLHLGVCRWPLTAHHLGQALRTETPDQLVSHDQQNATMCNHHALALLCGRCRHPCR